MNTIEKALVGVSIPEGDIFVPYSLRSYVTDVDQLEYLEEIGLYSAAQLVLRKMRSNERIFTHWESKLLAEAEMKFADPYWLCYNRIHSVSLTPEDKLKVIAKLGAIAERLGMTTTVVSAEVALSEPEGEERERSYYDDRLSEMMEDIQYFKDARKGMDRGDRTKIYKLGRDFVDEKYGREDDNEPKCGLPVTPENFEWNTDMIAAVWLKKALK